MVGDDETRGATTGGRDGRVPCPGAGRSEEQGRGHFLSRAVLQLENRGAAQCGLRERGELGGDLLQRGEVAAVWRREGARVSGEGAGSGEDSYGGVLQLDRGLKSF